MKNKLKPCPICGRCYARISTCKELGDCENFIHCEAIGSYSVVCDVNKGGCGASSGYFDSIKKAEISWNSRCFKQTNLSTHNDLKRTLIVVDMQNDFITGSLGSIEAVAILPSVKKKISEYISAGNEVIFTRDTHGEDYLSTSEGKQLPIPHCIKDTEGWKIPDELDVIECEHIDKPTFGWLHWNIRPDCEEVEIVGVCTDICVVSIALILKATFPETNITVDARCCAGTTLDSHNAALATMRSCQINVIGVQE